MSLPEDGDVNRIDDGYGEDVEPSPERLILLSGQSEHGSESELMMDNRMSRKNKKEWLKREKRRKDRISKQVRRMVFQRKKGGKYFNISFKNVPLSRRFIDFYHFVLDLAWWKVFLLFIVAYLAVHITFGLLYFFGALVDISTVTTVHENWFMVYSYCFFFSVDVMQTNGTFGIIVPVGIYQRSVVAFESFFCYFFETLWTAFILGKFARPSKMKKNFLFSKKAVLYKRKEEYPPIQHDENINVDGNPENDEGLRHRGPPKPKEYYNFVFRFSNIRCYKSPQMDVSIDLLLLLWRDEKFFRIFHLDYIVYEQTERSKNIQFANPLLPIPHQIRHTISEGSPLFSFVQELERRKMKIRNLSHPSKTSKRFSRYFEEDSMKERDLLQQKIDDIWEEYDHTKTRFEMVCIVEGIDSATSDNYQGFFSWTDRETFVDHEFEPCCFYSTRKNKFLVDYKMFHRIKEIQRKEQPRIQIEEE